MFDASTLQRFWAKVAVGPGCWEWTAGTQYGYGRFVLGGRTFKAHRLSYEISVGVIPDGLKVLHHCDNPPCVNPAHLFVGTHADNVRDREAKGRGNSVPASDAHRSQEHCPNGHPYDQANTSHYRGQRKCRTCASARMRAWRSRHGN
jgi:hypothetical protein